MLEQQGSAGVGPAALVWRAAGGAGGVPAAAASEVRLCAGLRTVALDPAARAAVAQRWQSPAEQARWLRMMGPQLLQHETAVKTKLTQPHGFPHLGPGSHLPPRHLEGGAPRPAVELADAEECDEVLEDYNETRRRVRALARPPPGHVPANTRARAALDAVRGGSAATARFLASAPGRIARFAALPRAERKATYARWWGVVKKEAKHYWVGTKLLAADVKIASRLVGRVLKGKTLSRRERNQLTRTAADIFRLVPMAVFVVVPFMELLLPVALKLFPNMLPSTFEDKLKKEEEMKRRIAARLEIARFLQDTVTEMAEDIREHRCGDVRTSAAELYHFMQRVRAGEAVPSSELLKFAKLFNDELTLDNLERSQLVSLCRFVGIQPFGTDAFLRGRLRRHLLEIKEDDREIQQEGLRTLTEDELRQACRARGMRAPFGEGAAAFMREQLAEWLDWSLNRSLPSSLLLLSRAFTVTQPVGYAKPRAVELDAVMLEMLSTEGGGAGIDVNRLLEIAGVVEPAEREGKDRPAESQAAWPGAEPK
eukprot:scaffold1.g5186.t1